MEQQSKSWTVCSSEELAVIKQKTNRLKEKDEVAAYFKALSDSTRLDIVQLLLLQEMCLCELTELLNSPPSTVTHHLKLLERGKVISARKDGKFTIFKLSNPSLTKEIISILEKAVMSSD